MIIFNFNKNFIIISFSLPIFTFFFCCNSNQNNKEVKEQEVISDNIIPHFSNEEMNTFILEYDSFYTKMAYFMKEIEFDSIYKLSNKENKLNDRLLMLKNNLSKKDLIKWEIYQKEKVKEMEQISDIENTLKKYYSPN